MNSLKIAAALRVLALAFESDEGDAAGQPVLAAEPQKRGRGRPVKGEDQPASGVAAPAAGSTNQAATGAAAALLAGTQTTALASAVDDPFAAPPAAPAIPVATLDEVRAGLKALQAASSQAVALEVLKTAGGADNLTSLDPSKYGAVVVAARIKGVSYAKPPAPEVDPFEVTTAATPAEKPPTLEDVKAVIVETQKRASQDKAQQVVMEHGGKAPNATGGEGVSLKALPEANYAATIAALKVLPTTK